MHFLNGRERGRVLFSSCKNFGGWCCVSHMQVPAWRRKSFLVMAVSPEMAERLAEAMLAQLDNWMEQAEEIAEQSLPVTGNRARALHLKMAMAQGKNSLLHILGRDTTL